MTTAGLQKKARLLLEEAKRLTSTTHRRWSNYSIKCAQAKTYGGNTSCLELAFDDQVFILDAGTGIRNLATAMLADGRATTKQLHIFDPFPLGSHLRSPIFRAYLSAWSRDRYMVWAVGCECAA